MQDFSTACVDTSPRLRPSSAWFLALAAIVFLIECPLQAADRYVAVISRVKAIDGSPCAQVIEIGKSAGGRPICAMLLADSKADDPHPNPLPQRERGSVAPSPSDANQPTPSPSEGEGRGEGHPGDVRVLVISGQHGDEVSPVLAMLDLAEDLSRGGLPANVRLVLVPVVNPDGFASHRRLNSHGADPNRSWASATEPEILSVQKLVNRFKPQVVIDLHEWMDRNPLHTNCIEVAGFGSKPQLKLARLLSAFTRHGMTSANIPQMVFYRNEADTRLAHRHFAGLGMCSLLVETASDQPRETRMRLYRDVVVTAVRTLARSDDPRIGAQLAAVSRGLGTPQPVFARTQETRPKASTGVGDIACWIVIVAATTYIMVRSLGAKKKASDVPVYGRLIYRMPLTDVVRANLPLHARVAMIHQQRVRPSDRGKGIGARVA